MINDICNSVVIVIHALLYICIRLFCNEYFIVSLDVLSPSVLAFDDLVNGPFADFMKFSNQIGGDVQQQVRYRNLETRMCSYCVGETSI